MKNRTILCVLVLVGLLCIPATVPADRAGPPDGLDVFITNDEASAVPVKYKSMPGATTPVHVLFGSDNGVDQYIVPVDTQLRVTYISATASCLEENIQPKLIQMFVGDGGDDDAIFLSISPTYGPEPGFETSYLMTVFNHTTNILIDEGMIIQFIFNPYVPGNKKIFLHGELIGTNH